MRFIELAFQYRKMPEWLNKNVLAGGMCDAQAGKWLSFVNGDKPNWALPNCLGLGGNQATRRPASREQTFKSRNCIDFANSLQQTEAQLLCFPDVNGLS
jgi:hypothetical protein